MTPIFEFGTSSVSNMLAYTGELISNVMPLIVVVLGIGIGLWIISYFIHR